MKNIVIIGAGTMGNGIAHCFAQHGFHSYLIGINQEVLEKAKSGIQRNLERQEKKGKLIRPISSILENITLSTSIEQSVANADLVIEAVTENIEKKEKVLREVDKFTPEGCILATNTSSISITKLASFTQNPANFIGMHFMNPVPIMPLIEVIEGYHTSKQTTNAIVELSKSIEKQTHCSKDYPGFIANRILLPMINEAIETLFQGVGSVTEIDSIMKLGMNHPMGPLQLADFIGLDVCLSILNVLYQGFGNPKYAPCPLLVNMVNAGDLGRKSGRGFYEYSDVKNPSVAQNFSK